MPLISLKKKKKNKLNFYKFPRYKLIPLKIIGGKRGSMDTRRSNSSLEEHSTKC